MDVPVELREQVADLTRFLDSEVTHAPHGYEVLESRLDGLKLLTQRLERSGNFTPDQLLGLREWFRGETAAWLDRSPLMRRARTWPEGYPGDYRTLEGVYANTPAGDHVGQLLDRYFLSRTLAVAVRSRCRHLSAALNTRAIEEAGDGLWLNLACGPCREMLGVVGPAGRRRVVCVDSDKNALEHAAGLLSGHPLGEVQYVAENAYRLINPKRNRDRYGAFTTIYSAGLFDYIPDDKLAPLLEGLYESLAPGGVFLAPFKDRCRYETFDYHWLVSWHYFYQRDESDFRRVFAVAGVPAEAITVERDLTGVLLFFRVKRPDTKPSRMESSGDS